MTLSVLFIFFILPDVLFKGKDTNLDHLYKLERHTPNKHCEKIKCKTTDRMRFETVVADSIITMIICNMLVCKLLQKTKCMEYVRAMKDCNFITVFLLTLFTQMYMVEALGSNVKDI